jgi:hypothetical protein
MRVHRPAGVRRVMNEGLRCRVLKPGQEDRSSNVLRTERALCGGHRFSRVEAARVGSEAVQGYFCTACVEGFGDARVRAGAI